MARFVLQYQLLQRNADLAPILLPLLLFLISVATATAARAEESPASWNLLSAKDWRVSAGPGVLVGPRYPGAARYRVLPIPAIEARNGNVFFSGRDGLGVDLFNAGGFRASTSVFARFGRGVSDDPKRLAGLPDIDAAPQIRLIAEQSWDQFKVRGAVNRDIGGGNGTTLDLDASVSTRLGNRVILSAGPQLAFGDTKFNRTYFGVAKSTATRPAHIAGAGLYEAGAGASLITRLDARWTGVATAAVTRLVGAAGRSPVVGAQTQVTGGVFLSYAFQAPDPNGRGRRYP